MIIDNLENADQYLKLHPRFVPAFRYLRNPAVTMLAAERVEIEGKNLFALMSRGQGKKRKDTKLEAHKKYIDIQCVFSGEDSMGWKSLGECRAVRSDYDEEKDVAFFDDEPLLWCPVQRGMFAIFFPGDAHAPLVSEGEIHKIIMKVAI